MMTKLVKKPNSIALRIPKAVAEGTRLRTGDHLEMAVEDSGILRIRKKKGNQTLRHLVRGITPENTHSESDWGAPAGNIVRVP